MGLLDLIQNKITEYREKKQEKRNKKEQEELQFQYFLEETKAFVNRSAKYPEAELYRTAWKRSIVLETIFKDIKELDKSKQHKYFQDLAAKNFFQVAPSNPYRRTKLEISQKSYNALHKKELKNLSVRLRAIEGHGKNTKKPNKIATVKRKSRNPRWIKSASTIKGYKPREDNTAIDNFVKKLINYLPADIIEISVSGLTTHPRRSSEKSDWISIIQNTTGKYKWLKTYKVGLLLDQSTWSLNETISALKRIEPYSTENYYDTRLKPIADKIYEEIKELVYGYDNKFTVSVGLKSKGNISTWIKIKLPISVHDAIIHCGNYLTEYPKKFLDEFEMVVDKRISADPNKLIEIYKDYDFRYKFFRSAEQTLRKKHDVPLIGEGHVTQVALYNLVKKIYPNAKHEYSPSWLGMQRFDIYIPNLKLAIEYNGPQHYMPIDLFGGEEGLAETKKRDDLKRKVSAANKVTLYEWPYTRAVNDEEVRNFVEEIENRLPQKP